MRLIPFHSNSLLDGYDFVEPFENFFSLMNSKSSTMSTDIMEEDGNIKLIMDLPGVSKEDIKVKLEDGNLVITASSDVSKEEKSSSGNYIRKERRSGKYSRSFYVGEHVTQEDIKAKFDNGTLTLVFPKEKPQEPPKQSFISIE